MPDPLILRVVDRIVSDGADAPSEGRWSSPNSPSRCLLGSEEEGEAKEEKEGGGDDSGIRADGSPGAGGSGSMGGAGSQSGGKKKAPPLPEKTTSTYRIRY